MNASSGERMKVVGGKVDAKVSCDVVTTATWPHHNSPGKQVHTQAGDVTLERKPDAQKIKSVLFH